MKTLASLLLVTVLFSVAFAADDVIVVETIGRGLERNEAVKDAIYLAVGKAKGIIVTSDEYEFDFFLSSLDIDRQDTKRTIDVDAVSLKTTGTSYKNKISGIVKTYEVLEEKELDDGTYEVKLKVSVYDYTPLDQTKKVKVAVTPVGSRLKSYIFGETKLKGLDVSFLLSKKLATALTQTNKFTALDRLFEREFDKEKEIIQQDGSFEEKARLYEVLGADYMLVAEITDLKLQKKHVTYKATQNTKVEYELMFSVSYSLISPVTRQIKYADDIMMVLERSELKQFTRHWQPERWDYKQIQQGVFAKMAKDIVADIIDYMYPVRIASIQSNNTLILNQAGKAVTKGQKYNVFSQGQNIIDVDTDLSLGNVENRIATVQVFKVQGNLSHAKIIKGDIADISVGLVCRQVKSIKREPKGAKRQVIRTRSGGVKLPFD